MYGDSGDHKFSFVSKQILGSDGTFSKLERTDFGKRSGGSLRQREDFYSSLLHKQSLTFA